jgi:hypothetical protein
MRKRRVHALAVFLLLVVLALPLFAVTMIQAEVICPICQTKNSFIDYAGWGSYVYSYPSRFQFVFWPHAFSASIYSCRKCHLSLFMWDFRKFPKDMIPETAKLLQSVTISGDFKTYTDIPASEKLEVAEKVYRLLGRDDEFWAQFYRVLGYYLAREKKPQEAAAARRHSLAITQQLLDSPANAGHKKELLLIVAAMHHFLGDDPAAKNELETAAPMKFSDEKLGQERSKNYDEYLSSLIHDYLDALAKNKVPDDID